MVTCVVPLSIVGRGKPTSSVFLKLFSLIDVFYELSSDTFDGEKVPFGPKKLGLLVLPVIDW